MSGFLVHGVQSVFGEIRHCTVELRKLFLTSMLGISTFRDSFRRIGNVLFNHSAQTMYISVVAFTSVGENTFRLLFKTTRDFYAF